MARGKHANRAELRRAEQATASEVATYQNAVKRLTAENQELTRRLKERERNALATERRLRAERDEGLAPHVTALERQVESLRERLDYAERIIRRADRAQRKIVDRCAHLLLERMPNHTYADVVAVIFPNSDNGDTRPLLGSKRPEYKLGSEATSAILRARGITKTGVVVTSVRTSKTSRYGYLEDVVNSPDFDDAAEKTESA